MMSKYLRHTLLLLFALSLGMLTGCLHYKEREKQLATGEQRPLPFANNSSSRTAAILPDEPLGVEESTTRDAADRSAERHIDFPERTSSRDGSEGLKQPYPDNLLKGLPDPDAEVEVKLTFNAADISEVLAAFAAPSLLNFSYLIDPAVKGAVTLSVNTTMTARQAWETFEHILWLSGAYASMNTGFIHILPFERMPQERKLFATHDAQPNVVVDFLPIRYRKSADVITQLRPFLTEGASITDLVDANTIIVVEAPANIEKIRELVSRLDNKGEREWPTGTFPCYAVDADVLANELSTLLPVLGFPVATGTGTSGGAVKLVALPRVRCIVVSAALPEVVEEVGKWVRILDRSDLMDKEEIFFYNVSKTTVDKLGSALETFFNASVVYNSSTLGSGSSSSSSSGRSTLNSSSGGLASTSSSTPTSTTSTRRSGGSGRTTSNGSNTANNNLPSQNLTVFETEVIAFADQESNRLTIKTTPRTWAVIRAFLERHDISPRQVAIKAIITEVTLDQNTQFGVTYAASKMFSHGNWNGGGAWAGAGPAANLAGDAAANITAISQMTSSGLALIIQNVNDPMALVSAVAGEGHATVLSEPQLVVVSGVEGTFNNGQSVAVPTQSTSYTSSSGNSTTNYEYRNVGVIMTVTPYITAGNEVELHITQEISTVAATSTNTNGTTAPDFNEKKVTTDLICKDNSTIMMGGMIQNVDTVTRTGIPFLKDIPYLGVLFGHDSHTHSRSELLILVTVNVIDNTSFQEDLIRRYKSSLEEIAKHQQDETY